MDPACWSASCSHNVCNKIFHGNTTPSRKMNDSYTVCNYIGLLFGFLSPHLLSARSTPDHLWQTIAECSLPSFCQTTAILLIAAEYCDFRSLSTAPQFSINPPCRETESLQYGTIIFSGLFFYPLVFSKVHLDLRIAFCCFNFFCRNGRSTSCTAQLYLTANAAASPAA